MPFDSNDFPKLIQAPAAFDWRASVEFQRRNFDALVEAGHVVTDGARAMLKRHAESAEDAFRFSMGITGTAMEVPNLPAVLESQAQLAHASTRRLMELWRELAEVACRTAGEVSGVLQARAEAGATEIKTLLRTAA